MKRSESSGSEMPIQKLTKKIVMERFLAYMAPSGERYRSVAHFSRELVIEAIEEGLIVQHPTRKRWFAISNKGYWALVEREYESVRLAQKKALKQVRASA